MAPISASRIAFSNSGTVLPDASWPSCPSLVRDGQSLSRRAISPKRSGEFLKIERTACARDKACSRAGGSLGAAANRICAGWKSDGCPVRSRVLVVCSLKLLLPNRLGCNHQLQQGADPGFLGGFPSAGFQRPRLRPDSAGGGLLQQEMADGKGAGGLTPRESRLSSGSGMILGFGGDFRRRELPAGHHDIGKERPDHGSRPRPALA